MSIRIFYDDVSYRYKGWRKLVNVLKEIINRKGKIGKLNIVITDDESLRAVNTEFLEHDYSTDVITFDYNTEDMVNGEIYISIDTVKENAVNYNVSLNDELSRVIIHGALHLTGFDDSTVEEKALIRREEDHWLKRLGELK